MKKTFCAIILALFAFAPSSMAMDFSAGVSANGGLFAATAREASTETQSAEDTEIAGVGYTSIFAEVDFGKFAVGFDIVTEGLESDTVETTKLEHQSGGTNSSKTNKLKVEFDKLTTGYVAFNITDNAYIKAGVMSVDVLTQEDLGTGGTYGDTSLDGTMLGFGYDDDMDAFFVRLEGKYLEFDGATVNSSNSDNSVSLRSLDGLTGSISLGKQF